MEPPIATEPQTSEFEEIEVDSEDEVVEEIYELSGDSEDEAAVEELYSLSGDEEYDVFESSEEELMDMNQPVIGLQKDDLLYDGAPITVSASYMMIFFFAKKYNLTLSGFQSLLQLIRTHCPQSNKCAKSVYKLKSFITEKFGGPEAPTTFRYCAVCCKKVKEGRTCATPGCTGKSKPLVQFYAGDLTPQLKKRMEGISLALSLFPIWDSKQLFFYWFFKRWIAPISTVKSLSSE